MINENEQIRGMLETRKQYGTNCQMDVWVAHLLDELEKANKEVKRLAQWVCPDCGFAFSVDHTDADSDEYSCPLCELQQISEEHTTMTLALKRISRAHFVDGEGYANIALNVLSTLKCTD